MDDMKTIHYDPDGRKISESRKSAWDDSKTIHYGPDGRKIGESQKSAWDDSKTIHYGPDGRKIGESQKSAWDDSKTIHYGPDGRKIGESQKSAWDDSKTIHYGSDGRKIGESQVGYGAGAGDLVGVIVISAVVLFLGLLTLLDKYPILEFCVEILLYICAVLYFIKRRRYKRTGNESDKPSKFLRRTTKILIFLV